MSASSPLAIAAAVIHQAVTSDAHLVVFRALQHIKLRNGRVIQPGDLVVLRPDHTERAAVVESALEPGELFEMFAQGSGLLEPVGPTPSADASEASSPSEPTRGVHLSLTDERRQMLDRRKDRVRKLLVLPATPDLQPG